MKFRFKDLIIKKQSTGTQHRIKIAELKGEDKGMLTLLSKDEHA